MIEKMKKVTIFSEVRNKHLLLLKLRELGVMHISHLVQKTPLVDELEGVSNSYLKVVSAIEETIGKKEKIQQLKLDKDQFLVLNENLLQAIKERDRLSGEIHELENERTRILPFGNFDPAGVKRLENDGIELHFYTLIPKELKKLEKTEDVRYLRISYNGKLSAIATVGETLPSSIPAAPFEMPKMSLAEIEAKLLLDKERIVAINSQLKEAGSYLDVFRLEIAKNSELITFEKASASVSSEDQIVYLSGYIPLNSEEEFKSFCKENICGYFIESPGEDDNPPTEIINKGPVKIIKPVFDMLGLVPGYRELDISLWFLLFLTLFFAMILGDAGYGLIFVIIAVAMNIKSKKCTLLNSLVYVFGVATVVWGALTGTWFGSVAILERIPFLQKLVIPQITNFPGVFGKTDQYTQDNMMQFCFMLGAIQIGLACIINVIRKLKKKDLSFLADIGWFVDIIVLYFLVLNLVIGKSANMSVIVSGVATGFVLTCLFGGFEPGMKIGKGIATSLGGTFTNFLDTISCFSNIMSYIRLFAVGMASLAIAESFNDMAIPLLKGFMLPAGVLVIVLGHTINLVMGLLSVVVHGVRLNVLEFSNQLGMEWTGYKYDPFKVRIIEK